MFYIKIHNLSRNSSCWAHSSYDGAISCLGLPQKIHATRGEEFYQSPVQNKDKNARSNAPGIHLVLAMIGEETDIFFSLQTGYIAGGKFVVGGLAVVEFFFILVSEQVSKRPHSEITEVSSHIGKKDSENVQGENSDRHQYTYLGVW
ncbi:hypothetical protein ACP70R_049284 [Stipagrostis hirtigluma subsp. patula]